MNNIFENAYFGKAYKTRDGRKALYHSYDGIYPDNPYQDHHTLILEKKDGVHDTVWIWCNDYGHVEEHIEGKWLEETNPDIISEWEESLNDEELEMLAFNNYCNYCHYCESANAKTLEEKYEACQKSECYRKTYVWKLITGYKAGYKAGYRKTNK